MINIANDWSDILDSEINSDYYRALQARVDSEYSRHEVFPRAEDIFNALELTSYSDTKVIILGQDPYHNDGQAHGLSFSVQHAPHPPSLQNILRELQLETGQVRTNGELTDWAREGVLLLNSILTVRAHCPLSHSNLGWEKLTDAIITHLGKSSQPRVFLLWGKLAIAKSKLVTSPNHLILTAPHPSPLSAYRGFVGCNHFVKANEFLRQNNLAPIDWIGAR